LLILFLAYLIIGNLLVFLVLATIYTLLASIVSIVWRRGSELLEPAVPAPSPPWNSSRWVCRADAASLT